MFSFFSSLSRGATVSLCAGLEGNLTLLVVSLLFSVPSSSLCVMSKKLIFCYG